MTCLSEDSKLPTREARSVSTHGQQPRDEIFNHHVESRGGSTGKRFVFLKNIMVNSILKYRYHGTRMCTTFSIVQVLFVTVSCVNFQVLTVRH